MCNIMFSLLQVSIAGQPEGTDRARQSIRVGTILNNNNSGLYPSHSYFGKPLLTIVVGPK